MAKIIGRIVKEMHGFYNTYVMRPYGNETIVEPEENESLDSIIRSVQAAIDSILPYVRNCPTGNWTGRATTYITVQPIKGDKRDEFIKRLNGFNYSGACLMRDHDFDGRVQLILFTPSPMDSIVPANEEFIDVLKLHGNRTW